MNHLLSLFIKLKTNKQIKTSFSMFYLSYKGKPSNIYTWKLTSRHWRVPQLQKLQVRENNCDDDDCMKMSELDWKTYLRTQLIKPVLNGHMRHIKTRGRSSFGRPIIFIWQWRSKIGFLLFFLLKGNMKPWFFKILTHYLFIICPEI